MDSSRWSRIQQVFEAALSLPEADRPAYLSAEFDGNAELIAEVEAMLAADRRNTSLLDRGLPEIAYELVGKPFDAELSREFGPYRLKKVLGEGGMGVVWLAERADAGNLVAIKFLPHAAFTPARRERFAREIRTQAKLEHPHIARLYDAGTLEDGTPWFVMEYVKGVPIDEYCAGRDMPIEERLRIFRAACEAVQYAHAQATLHRDLKPSNILVTEDGKPKLLDFGIAKELDHLGDQEDQTSPAFRFLSWDYAAPEWIRDGVQGLYTDVYSLGVILYKLLSGQLPFDRANIPAADFASYIASHDPEKPSVIARQVAAENTSQQKASREKIGKEKDARENHDGEMNAEADPKAVGISESSSVSKSSGLSKSSWSDLDLLCLKAVHRDVGQRYPSVEALIRDIDHYLKCEPLEARPDSARYRMGKFVQRNQRAVLAASCTIALIAGLSAFYTIGLARARDRAVAEAARTKRIQRFMLNMLGANDAKAAPANDLRVVTLLEHGVQEAKTLNADPESQGDLYENLGVMYDRLGDYPKAEELLALALDRAKKTPHPDEEKIAEILIEIGLLDGDEAYFDDGIPSVQQGLNLLSARLPANDPKVLAAKTALGKMNAEYGYFTAAIPILKPLVDRQPTGTETDYALSDSLGSLAISEYAMGNHAEAEALSQRALDLDRKLFGPTHPQVAGDLLTAGMNADVADKEAEAESDYRQAIAIDRAWYGPDHPDIADIEIYLARVLQEEGKADEARSLLHQIIDYYQRFDPQDDAHLAKPLDLLGKDALGRGNAAEAEAFLTRAVAIAKRVYQLDGLQTAATEVDLAKASLLKKDYAQADRILSEAVPNILKQPSASPVNSARGQLAWGRALFGLKRYSEAEKQFSAAYKIYKTQGGSSAGELKEAGVDLASTYNALKRPADAEKIRAEIAGIGNQNAATHP